MIHTDCPTCTCQANLLNAKDLLAILRTGKDVYQGNRSRRWFVTHGGGETSFHAVQELLRSGAIQSKWGTDDYFKVSESHRAKDGE